MKLVVITNSCSIHHPSSLSISLLRASLLRVGGLLPKKCRLDVFNSLLFLVWQGGPYVYPNYVFSTPQPEIITCYLAEAMSQHCW